MHVLRHLPLASLVVILSTGCALAQEAKLGVRDVEVDIKTVKIDMTGSQLREIRLVPVDGNQESVYFRLSIQSE